MERDQLSRDYDEAVAQERLAWAQARGTHVGSADYDKAVWDRWLQAAAMVKHLAEQLEELKP